jgi:hypothetical protein
VDFDKPHVLLCEGVSDERFYNRLFQVRNIGSDFTVRSPSKEGAYGGGVTNFGEDLRNISVSESFLENVKAVLVVGDNDSDMAASLQIVRDQLKSAPGFGVPDVERVVAESTGGLPKVVILMLPMGEPGNLESLCLEAAYAKFGLKQELDTFVATSPARDWSVGKQAKMRMQTILAATNKSKPDAGFGGHWSSPDKYHLPVDHQCFNELADFLVGFPAMVA